MKVFQDTLPNRGAFIYFLKTSKYTFRYFNAIELVTLYNISIIKEIMFLKYSRSNFFNHRFSLK